MPKTKNPHSNILGFIRSEGMGNPGSRNSQSAGRRSARLLSKSYAMTKPQRSQPRKPSKSVRQATSGFDSFTGCDFDAFPGLTPLFTYVDPDRLPDFDPVLLNRQHRRLDAERFRRDYTYGCNNSMEQKTLIWSSGTHTWLDKSSGIIWVAVHGRRSICVVTRNEHLDMTRVGGFLKCCPTKQAMFGTFTRTVVSEIEDLADPSSEICQGFNLSISEPFAVVSVIPGAREESGHEQAISDEYDEKKAIKFLREKIQSYSTFTYTETIKTAISAFQHLFGKEFMADDIKVTVFEEAIGTSCTRGGCVEWLGIHDIERHLAVINCRE